MPLKRNKGEQLGSPRPAAPLAIPSFGSSAEGSTAAYLQAVIRPSAHVPPAGQNVAKSISLRLDGRVKSDEAASRKTGRHLAAPYFEVMQYHIDLGH
ncbi:hypothetical protein EYF80_003433 [Liparis tanakae]|uniref:Uncharacterized protein n=1 Tax=Liparis tanakae TaxID=230148 RepID=A0A4Z2J9J4_9TELE|nr:hypothetical protein EYF80_003433 [Liparis tanakae]